MAGKKTTKWYFVTNTNNLSMIMANGFIPGSDGFGGKYYSDILKKYPNKIPLYKNSIPNEVVNEATSEEDGLVPCIIEISISKIRGSILAYDSKNLKEEMPTLSLKDSLDSYEMILIQAPLPLPCIKKILFSSKSEKDNYLDSVNVYNNVYVSSSCTCQPKLFPKSEAENHQNVLFESYDRQNEQLYKKQLQNSDLIDYNEVLAYGGALTMLFLFSKNSDYCDKIFKSLSDGSLTSSSCNNDALKSIVDYFGIGRVSKTGEFDVYKKVIELLIGSHSFKNDLLSSFKKGFEFNDERGSKRLAELAVLLD